MASGWAAIATLRDERVVRWDAAAHIVVAHAGPFLQRPYHAPLYRSGQNPPPVYCDEADEMLDLGFKDDLELYSCSSPRNTPYADVSRPQLPRADRGTVQRHKP